MTAIRAALANHRAGRSEAAAVALERILRDHADHLGALEAAASVAADRGHHDAVADYCRRALGLAPERADLLNARGAALLAQGDSAAAISCLSAAVALAPEYSDALYNLGCAHQAAGDLDAAADAFHRAQKQDPENISIYNNLGVVFKDLDHIEDAVACLRAGLDIDPDSARLHHNLGLAFRQGGDPAAAVRCFDRVLDIDPANVNAHFCRATALLLGGDYAAGFDDYEWRWRMPGGKPRRFASAAWDGAADAAATVLLHHEQGHGDSIQFARFVPLVRERVGRVVLECPPALTRLLATVDGVDEVVADGATADADAHAALGSLPRLLGTRLDSLPAEVPYLRPDPALTALWAPRLDVPGLKVGLVWAGNPRQPSDRKRSTRLAVLAALGAIEGASFFSLQVGPGRRDLDDGPPPFPLVDLGSEIGDFADTAAIIEQLDLVITTCTSVAHLAGALGRPVWTMLCRDADWRWLVDRTDSPWYPTMRLFRQRRAGDWAGVVDDVGGALAALIEEDGKR
jgi:Tfp pilus assembly protein PilF